MKIRFVSRSLFCACYETVKEWQEATKALNTFHKQRTMTSGKPTEIFLE